MVRSINTLGMRTVFCWPRLKNPISFLISIACDAISSASLKQIAFLALLTLYRRRVHCTSRNYTQWRTKETTATQRKNVLECPKWRENSTNRNTLAFSSHIFTLFLSGHNNGVCYRSGRSSNNKKYPSCGIYIQTNSKWRWIMRFITNYMHC